MRQRIRLYIFILIAGVAVFLGYILENDTAFKITRGYTREIFIAVHLLFGASLAELLWRNREALRGWASGNRRLIAISVLVVGVASGFTLSREKTNYKITADEYVLSLEAMSLHMEGLSTVPLRLHMLGGVPRSLGGTINKRPPAFVTLLSLVHDVTGYRSQNVFYLNGALVVAFYGLLFGFVCRMFGLNAAIFACALWASFPLFYQNASGGGFEILNLVYMLVFLVGAWYYLAKPSTWSQRFFVLTAILLANTRYESALFVISAGVVILYQWVRDRRILCDTSLFLAPLVMSTYLLRMRVFENDQRGNWQVVDGQSPFSIDYFYDNIGHAMNYFLAFSRASTTSEYLWVTGLIGGAFMIYGAAKEFVKGIRSEWNLPLLVVSGVILVNFGVLMFYHWGQLDYPEVSRLGLPLALMASLGSVFLFFRMIGTSSIRWTAWVLLLVFTIGFAVPRAAMAVASNGNFHVRRADWLLDQVRRMPPRSYVVAGVDAGRLFLEQIPGTPIAVLNERPQEAAYHLKLGSYELLVAQRFMVSPETGEAKVMDDDWLHPAFQVEPIAETAHRPFVIVRLSRVISIDPELAQKPAKELARPADEESVGTKPPGADVAPVSVEVVNEWINKLP